MTQAVTNNMNNIQELMTQAQQKASSVVSEVNSLVKNTSNIDKNETLKSDNKFDRIFEKQIQSKTKETVPPTNAKTIGDVKSKVLSSEDAKSLADFREILAEITQEANVETSLDLSLGRDINEIISQLKEAFDATIDVEETTVEESSVVEELVTAVDNELVASDDAEVDMSQLIGEQEEVLCNQIAIAVSQSSKNVPTEVEFDANLISEDANLETAQSDVEINIFDEIPEVIKPVVKDSEQNKSQLEDIIDEDIIKELNIEEVKVDTSSSHGESSLMDQQTPQEQGVKAMLSQEIESFDVKIDKALSSQVVQAPQVKSAEVNPSKIIEQVTKQLEGLQNTSKVNIVLNPEALGKVTVQLIKTGEGLSAQFAVANQEVRDMLMKGLDGLKETLTAHGVGVDNVTVKLNDTQKSEYTSDWTEQEGSRGGNKEQGRSQKDEKEKGLFEQMMAQFNEENGKV